MAAESMAWADDDLSRIGDAEKLLASTGERQAGPVCDDVGRPRTR